MNNSEEIKKMFDDKNMNIAIGQGINNACLLLKDREDFILLDDEGKKEAIKRYAKIITDALLEMRMEYKDDKVEGEQPL